MTRYGMLIDTKKCVGCYACRVACQNQNGLDPDEAFVRFEEREVGSYPSTGVETVPMQCMHCEDAPCVSVCPTGASHIGADGIVSVDHGKCIGCLYCVAACPYQVRVRNSKTGAVDKCRFCNVSNYENGTNMTTCVTACPMHLMPLELSRLAEKGDFEACRREHALDCIECGSCSYGCPAKLPLVHNIRVAKRFLARRR